MDALFSARSMHFCRVDLDTRRFVRIAEVRGADGERGLRSHGMSARTSVWGARSSSKGRRPTRWLDRIARPVKPIDLVVPDEAYRYPQSERLATVPNLAAMIKLSSAPWARCRDIVSSDSA